MCKQYTFSNEVGSKMWQQIIVFCLLNYSMFLCFIACKSVSIAFVSEINRLIITNNYECY